MLFRLFLALPAYLLSALTMLGWGVAALVIWLIVLITGRYPRQLFAATTSLLRFNLRVNAYGYLLTSRYPRGLFGDPAAQQPEVPSSVVPDAPRGIGLSLTGAAKGLVALFIVLGVVGFAGYGGAIAYVATHEDAARQGVASDLRAAYRSHITASTATLQMRAAACKTSAERFTCVQRAELGFADELQSFDSAVRDIDPPNGTDDEFVTLRQLAVTLRASYRSLGTASSVDQYVSRLKVMDLKAQGAAFDTAYRQLIADLS